jgi:hypothetical protein
MEGAGVNKATGVRPLMQDMHRQKWMCMLYATEDPPNASQC